MAMLLRLVKSDIWADLDFRTGSDARNFPAQPLEQIFSIGGTSVWQVNNQEEIVDTLAISSLGRSTIKDLGYITFDEAALLAIGIKIVKTPGRTVDTIVNDRHRDLKIAKAGHILDLARLAASANFGSAPAGDLLDVIAEIFQSGRIDKLKFRQNQKLPSKDAYDKDSALLHWLFGQSHLSFIRTSHSVPPAPI